VSVTTNAKGTSYKSFTIGKKGVTIFQGPTDPSLTESVKDKDVWINTSDGSIKVYNSASWLNPAFDDITISGNTISSTGDLNINASSGNINIGGAPVITTSSTSDDIGEGSTNLFFTNSRARSAISVASSGIGSLSYNSSTGVITYTGPTSIVLGTQTSGSYVEDITAGSGITVTSGTGASSNPTIAVDSSVVRTTGSQTINGTKTFSDLRVTADPSTPLQVASKQYVDSVATGLDTKNSVRVATTGNITLSGLQTIDGVALQAGDRVLVKDQINAAENGIYTVSSGAWSRASDADNTPNNEVSSGMYTFVDEGTINKSSGFVLVTPDPITLDTTPLTFTVFTNASDIVAGSGLSKTGNTISADLGSGLALSGNSIVVDSSVVRTTGAQTISGTKTFNSPVVASSGVNIPFVAATEVPMVVLDGATSYGLFHEEGTNDTFRFKFGGAEAFAITQNTEARFFGKKIFDNSGRLYGTGPVYDLLTLERTDSDNNVDIVFKSPTKTRYLGMANGELKWGSVADLGASGDLIWHAGNFDPSTKFDSSGGTLTGKLTLKADQYSLSGLSGLDAANSDIVGINALKFNDLADSWSEGLLFPKSNGLSRTDATPSNWSGLRYTGTKWVIWDGSADKELTYEGYSPAESFVASGGGDWGFIQRPAGGEYSRDVARVNGHIQITLPSTFDGQMITFWVDIYSYVTNRTETYRLSGYVYNTGTSTKWINCSVVQIGGTQERTVYFGDDGNATLGSRKPCVWIGTTSSVWEYPKVTIRDVTLGFVPTAKNYRSGWAVDINITARTTVGTETSIANKLLDSKSSGTVGGTLTVSSAINIQDSSTALSKGTANSLKITTPSGYVDIGSQNTSWAHYNTNRPQHYFNKPLRAATSIGVYNSSTYMDGTTVYENGTALNAKYLGIGAKAADSDKLDGIDSTGFTRYSASGSLSNALASAAWVVNNSGTSNIDHIWYDDAANAFNFCADTTFKGTANARINAGSVVASTYDTSSKRWKTNIKDLILDERFDALEPVTFTWDKKDDVRHGTDDFGFIAEYVYEQYPELVIKDNDGNIVGVNYAKVTPLLVAKAKKQDEKILKQDEKIESLENKVAELEKQIQAIKDMLSNG